MQNLIIVNGERWWPAEFPGWNVVQIRIQTAGWLYRSGVLSVVTESGTHHIDAVLWRVGAIRVTSEQYTALHLIRLAGVPCVNSPRAIENSFHRLGMLATLREVGVTTVDVDASSGDMLWSRGTLATPFVVKVGTHHGGLAKMRIENEEVWAEVSDLLYAANDFVATEPFIENVRDVRCLLIAGRVWAMERRAASWRANVDTTEATLIEAPPLLEEWTRRVAERLDAPIMALDALETTSGEWVVLESNETPGITGFPPGAREGIVMLVNAHLTR